MGARWATHALLPQERPDHHRKRIAKFIATSDRFPRPSAQAPAAAAASVPPPVQPAVLPGTPAPGAAFPFTAEQLIEKAKQVSSEGKLIQSPCKPGSPLKRAARCKAAPAAAGVCVPHLAAACGCCAPSCGSRKNRVGSKKATSIRLCRCMLLTRAFRTIQCWHPTSALSEWFFPVFLRYIFCTTCRLVCQQLLWQLDSTGKAAAAWLGAGAPLLPRVSGVSGSSVDSGLAPSG